jgi:energy-coupling factor transporter ATP-binding protein EcfA2
MTPEEFPQLQIQLNSVFTPAAPIEKRRLFAGRVKQLEIVLDAALEPGRHVVIYGERGVGKTSLANILAELLPERLVIRVAADSTSNYDSLWRKIFRRLMITQKQRRAGFVVCEEKSLFPLADVLPKDVELAPDKIISIFDTLRLPTILIFDEFDRITDQMTPTLVADTIKAFSDTARPVTLVVVGVAQTVNELIGEHPSIERNLRQIKMPRMSLPELAEIIDKGLAILEMDIEESVRSKIIRLSQGFPHYTHLLAKYSAGGAIDHERLNILEPDLDIAIEKAVEDARESIRAAYHKATLASRRETLFPKVLLAAALAPEDEFGTFRASDLLEPLRRITGRASYSLPSFTYHLGKLCSEERGNILDKLGTQKRHRYRFANPLMKSFILLKGYSERTIDLSSLNGLH